MVVSGGVSPLLCPLGAEGSDAAKSQKLTNNDFIKSNVSFLKISFACISIFKIIDVTKIKNQNSIEFNVMILKYECSPYTILG